MRLHISRHGLVLKSLESLDGKEKNLMYLNNWKESLIPLCSNTSQTSPHLCSEFRPSLSNNGLCFTKNQAPLDNIYRDRPYIQTFNDVFLKERDEFPVSKNMGSGQRYKNSFLINANQVMDLRRGVTWKQTKQASFRLGINSNHDMPEMRDTSIKIDAGYKTLVRVHTMQLESQESIRTLTIVKRNCRFSFESERLLIFKHYSRYVYVFEYL